LVPALPLWAIRGKTFAKFGNPQSAIRNPQSEKAVVNERISESASGNSELTGSLPPGSLTAPANPQSPIRNPQLK
jgi:hypothetical protein